MEDFNRGLRIVLAIRAVKRPFKWFVEKCDQWEDAVGTKYQLF